MKLELEGLDAEDLALAEVIKRRILRGMRRAKAKGYRDGWKAACGVCGMPKGECVDEGQEPEE